MSRTKLLFMGAASIGAQCAMAAALERDRAPVVAEVVDEIHPPPANPLEELPDSHVDWRVNKAALEPLVAQSPLETRQQRRRAGIELARGLAMSGKLKEREARVLDRKKRRADEAAARFNRIANHVPSKP